jgi:hypothetical protein
VVHLQGPVCITQLLSHLLFLAANGGSMHATALPDTFTTPAFVRVGVETTLPPEFVQDMADRWGEDVEPGGCVFDLFRVWRLDSGCYRVLAQLLHDTWQRRNTVRAAAGAPPLPRLQLLHSNISSLDDIREVGCVPAHLLRRCSGPQLLLVALTPRCCPALPLFLRLLTAGSAA